MQQEIQLRAGSLKCIFQRDNGFLRYLSVEGQEVLRGIYVAVRDQNWNTIPSEVKIVRQEIESDSFQLELDVTCREGEVDFRWRSTLAGSRDGVITYDFLGRAASSFVKNRIGFCILHPASVAGKPCKLSTVENVEIDSRFPLEIAAHQPFVELKSLAYEVCPGLNVKVRMEGEIFETEDQRNWTDASFKTYCTPLSRPFPERVYEYEPFWQRVTVTLDGTVPKAAMVVKATDRVLLEMDTSIAGNPMPKAGILWDAFDQVLSRGEKGALRALRPAHLRVDLDTTRVVELEAVLGAATDAAKCCDADLEIVLHVSEHSLFRAEDWMERILAITNEVVVARWILFQKGKVTTPASWPERFREVLSRKGQVSPLGSGTDAYFAEFNRNPPDSRCLHFGVYSINPQVHAFDDDSLIETLEIQGETVWNARRLLGGKPVVVSPVTFLPRFNPAAMELAGGKEKALVSVNREPRQSTAFGLVWTLGSLKYLTAAGAESGTFHSVTGSDGFKAPFTGVYKLAHQYVEWEVCPLVSDHKLVVDGMVLKKQGRLRVVIWNYSASSRKVLLKIPAKKGATKVDLELGGYEMLDMPVRR